MKYEVVGKRFNKLFVLDTWRRDKNGNKSYECLCDCKRTHFVTARNLVCGGTTQCSECSKTRYARNRTTTYRVAPEGHIIGTTGKGLEFLFDARHLAEVSKYSWSVKKDGAVMTGDSKYGQRMTLHRLISGTLHMPRGSVEVDHRNTDRGDNRDSNLRLATRQQNCRNSSKFSTSNKTASMYKGVSWSKAKCKWVVRVNINRKPVYNCYFTDEVEAAIAYNNKAVEHFGEFARINVIEEPGTTISYAEVIRNGKQ
jgi:hypothetical protein